MSIDSDHINYLVLRYLQESGFQHSSFTFAQECGVTRTGVAGTKIPAGSLIAHLQRALNYVQAEVNLLEDGRPADLEDLDAVEALTLIESVQPQVCEQRRQQLHLRIREANQAEKVKTENAEEDNDEPQLELDKEVSPSKVLILKGHTSEVVACKWNPSDNIIASGSGDSTARIWPLVDGQPTQEIILRHFSTQGEESRDVTTLDWNATGTLLATGSYDGTARIWTSNGELQNRLTGHSGPIFSCKWNKTGDLLATTSVDHTVIVWEPKTGQIKQTFANHTAPCLDIDWREDNYFASCSTDKAIYVCQLDNSQPVKVFKGHSDEVNCVRWDCTGTWLASCSDDCTVKVWSLGQDDALHALKHDDKIYSLAWAPLLDKKDRNLLASASCDSTTKVWNGGTGECIYTLKGHTLPVYSVDFSPDGRHLATGSFDNRLLVWSLAKGELEHSYHGSGGIFEVCWDRTGEKVAACYSDHTLSVVSV